MGFTGAHVLYTFDAFILALYLLFHGCALLKYTCKPYYSGDLDDLCDLEKKHSLHLKCFTERNYSLNTIQYCRQEVGIWAMLGDMSDSGNLLRNSTSTRLI